MELYIHLPFCVRKCRYCDFASYPGHEADIPDYVSAVIREMELRSEALGCPEVRSVYLGGGTPSLLAPEELERLLRAANRCFPFAAEAEITSEANPGTLTAPWLRAAVQGGVNRLSLGMQAAQPALLALLGRIHTLRQVRESVQLAREAGITNLNLDLMFGIPTQRMADWRETVETALALEPQHLSCYGLIPEEGTPLQADLEAGRLVLPPEDTEREMYDWTLTRLAECGYEQYEISNFARPGYCCLHNVGYWTREPYVGVGCSAASLLPGNRRETNPSTIPDYLRMMADKDGQKRTVEQVSPEEAMFETMMLGLRMTEGVSEADFLAAHGVSLDAVWGDTLRTLAERELLAHRDGRWFLTRRGMDIQNSVLVELM